MNTIVRNVPNSSSNYELKRSMYGDSIPSAVLLQKYESFVFIHVLKSLEVVELNCLSVACGMVE